MSLGRRSQMNGTEALWVSYEEVPKGPSQAFYSRLERILQKYAFDTFCEELCEPYYAEGMGRPSIPPGVYFRMLMMGYFEGISSERGIAWKAADSKSLEGFLGYGLLEEPPDHSSLSRIRRRLPLEVHKEVFAKVLEMLRQEGLLKGKKIGLDATQVEANAAMRSIRRKIDGKRYTAYLRKLARESTEEEPSREDPARLNRPGPDEGFSNRDWQNPHDPEARIAKMKDGSTHLAYKAEHAMDLETGALVGAVIQLADKGDTETLWETVAEAAENLQTVQERSGEEEKILEELVADKGYHSKAVLMGLEELSVRSYIPEPDWGRRRWRGDQGLRERRAVYANRRRIRTAKGGLLQRLRAEILERSFAHMLQTGGMRRVWLRGRENVWKRYLIHACAFNLSLVMRKLYRAGTPRGLEGLVRAFLRLLSQLFCRLAVTIEPKSAAVFLLAA